MFPTEGAKKMQKREGSVFHALKDSRLLHVAILRSGRLISVFSGVCLLSAECIQAFLRV